MKKGIFSAIIILLFAGYVFYRGWANIRVSADEYAVVSTKTSGVLDRTVENGDFFWCWQMVIPANVSFIKFEKKEYVLNNKFSGSLPSAEIYSKLLKGEPDFTYDFEYTLKASADRNQVLALVKNGQISSSQDLNEYLNRTAEKIAKKISQHIIDISQDKVLAYYDEKQILNDLKISETYPQIAVNELFIKSIKVPDLRLYNIARDSYKKFQDVVDENIKEAAKLQAEQFVADQKAFLKLEKIGTLLKDNPELNSLLSNGSAADVLKALNELN